MSEEKGLLLKIRGLRIEGRADEKWFEIVHGVDLDLRRGEVMGLIGESGAGKSTIGLAAMGFARDGCRISAGSIEFDGMELTSSPEEDLRMLRGARIAYVAQSAAASFNPAHKLIDQHTAAPVQHQDQDPKRRARPTRWSCTGACACPIRARSASATRTRSRAGSSSAR